jgi:hypothetical protein
MRSTKDLETVIGELLALAGVIRTTVPKLTAAQILEIIAETPDAASAAPRIVAEHIRAIGPRPRFSIVGPIVH